jgi:hypothetical protein
LISQGGKRKFLSFVEQGLKHEDWARAIRENYGHEDLLALQNTWLDWVKSGSPQLKPNDATLMAAASTTKSRGGQPTYRAQSPDSQMAASGSFDASPSTEESGLVLVGPPTKESSRTVLADFESQDPDAAVSDAHSSRVDNPTAGGANAAALTNPGKWRPAGTTDLRAVPTRAAAQSPEPIHSQQSARPQPPQAAQQVIVEPSRTASASSSSVPNRTGTPYPSREPIRDSRSGGGTVLR